MATAGDRPTPDPAGRSGARFDDAIAGGRVDRFSDALGGEAAGGMIGGADPQPLTVDALATDSTGGVDPVTAATGYLDVLSEAFPPAPAAEPAPLPVLLPATTGPTGRRANPVQGRQRPVQEPNRRRPRQAGDPTRSASARVTPAARPPAIPQGTVPTRISPPATDGRRARWVGRVFILLVLGAIVFGNVAHGCASRLADQVDPTHPASVSGSG